MRLWSALLHLMEKLDRYAHRRYHDLVVVADEHHTATPLVAANRRGVRQRMTNHSSQPVAPEFRTWDGPPATEFIASLTAHLDIAYYVGWLAASSLHGAAHQAPQVTHVATSGMVRARQIGRARLVCHQPA
jgi:hypothetical protein